MFVFFKESAWVCWISVFLFVFLFILLYYISMVQFILSSFDVPIISHFLCSSLFNAINYLLFFLKNNLYFWKYYLGFPINFFQPFPLTPLHWHDRRQLWNKLCSHTPSPNIQCDCIWLGPFRDVIKFKWGHKSRSLIQRTGVIVSRIRDARFILSIPSSVSSFLYFSIILQFIVTFAP